MPAPALLPRPPWTAPLGLVLKAQTRDVHDGLDQHLLKQRIFASRERHLRFLRVQWHFHEAVASLDRSADTAAGRLHLIVHDLADLDARPPTLHAWRPSLHVASPSAAPGWHYVAEGSTLGASVLQACAGASDAFQFVRRCVDEEFSFE